jgi:predicted Zn-dependent peptidase
MTGFFYTLSKKTLIVTTTLLCLLFFLFCPPGYSFSLGSRVQEFTLHNGLKVLLMERHQSPTVSLYMRFKVGAVDEESGSTGIAHLLEHMLFKGTKTLGTTNYREEKKILEQIDQVGEMLDAEQERSGTVPTKRITELKQELARLQKEHKKYVVKDEIDSIYARNGAVGFNASTGNDITTYEVSLPSNRIELWARIESDRLSHPVFREFYSERDVVMEEFRQSYESNPERTFMTNFLATAFIVHPYRNPIIGWKSDVPYLGKKEMISFFQSHYVPNNAVLAIVGDIDVKQTLTIIKNYFAQIPSQPLPFHNITTEPEQMGERQIEVKLDAEPRVLIGYHKPTILSFEDYVFDIIDALLASGRTSRLYKSLVVEKKLATSITTGNGLPGARYPNLFVIEALPRKPHSCAEVSNGIYREIERLKREPVTDKELQKIKNQLQADFIRGLKNNNGLASQLSYYQIICDNWRYLEQHMAMIDKITPQDIQRIAAQYLHARNRTVARLISNKKIP